MENVIDRAIDLPLGAAPGPTAQGLLCAELGEESRALNNPGGGADTLRPGTQVFVRGRQKVNRPFQSSVSED